ncbi:MAG TPA: MFS transporter [Micromonosporaceae bacterium]|nr:MFS transporter [Micromonosporaceae bacterium]
MSGSKQRSLLRDRHFATLFVGETVSELGSTITFLAFPLIAIGLHASTFAVGAIAAATNAAWLFVALPAGAWVDRVRRRPVLIACDLVSAALLASVPVAWALHVLTVLQLGIVGFATGAVTVVFEVAYPAFLPSLISKERLVDGNGLMEAGLNGARIAGPSLGGVLVQTVGGPVTLLVDTASFLVAAAGLSTIRVTEPHKSKRDRGPRSSMRADIAAGLRYVLGSPPLRTLVGAVAVGNFVFGGYGAVVLVFFARQLGLAAGVIGVVVALGGVGGIIGSLVSGPIANRIGNARLMWLSTLVVTPVLLLVPLGDKGPRLALSVAGVFLTNGALVAFNVCVRAALQRTAPAEILGRVTASIRVFSRGALPLGALVGGAIAGAWTPRVALVTMLLGYAIVPLLFWRSPIARSRTFFEDDAPTQAPGEAALAHDG